MGALITIVGLLATGPLIGIGALVADAYSGGPPPSSKRLIISAMGGGVLASTPASCAAALASHNPAVGFPLGLATGAIDGLLTGLVAVAVRYAWTRPAPREEQR